MDIQLARTFLTVIADGNFGSAALSLFITQSAVSLRIKRLEELLGQKLFERSKSGVVLTPAGAKFERYAISMVRIWEETRYQVSVPDGFGQRLVIGGQYSLLPKLVMRWLGRLETELPETAFRLEAGMPERLMRLLIEGTLDIAVMYMPQLRPGLVVEELIEEELVLVTADIDGEGSLSDSYLFIDWGPEFTAHHGSAFPELPIPRVTFAIGTLGIDYMIREKRAGYLPARAVREHLDRGTLALVANAPTFKYPCYVVYNADLDEDLLATALGELKELAKSLDDLQDKVIDDLEDISDEAFEHPISLLMEDDPD